MAPVVLITGSSTGVGAACVARMAAKGWTVLAGVRRPDDGDRLVAEVAGDVRPLLLDVTDTSMIEQAANTVETVCGRRGLRGLVNNAGVPLIGPVELVPVAQWREHLEVNLLGAVAMTRAMFDHVRVAGGRFVYIGSQTGRIAVPGSATYAAGKHGLEALTEALRHELAPTSMRVALIEPGQINTPLLAKSSHDIDRLAQHLQNLNRPEYRQLLSAARAFVRGGSTLGLAPDRVARQVEHALSAARPKRRYLIGADAWLLGGLVTRLPDPLRDRTVAAVVRAYAWAGRRIHTTSTTSPFSGLQVHTTGADSQSPA
jgi:NAD(P)-dependent dehydrogenase (short-subunit alcohol dehydrogenase family)